LAEKPGLENAQYTFYGTAYPDARTMGMTDKEILATLYSWLGPRTVLLPIPLGTKKPDWTGWQQTTFEQTQTPEYQARLIAAITRGGNIGVLLINGLVSIDIDADKLVDEFLAINPELDDTLQSKGVRGRNIWLQLTGEYPREQAYYCLKTASGEKWGEFRCYRSQTVIFGQHPNGTPDHIIRYFFVSKQPIMQGTFDAIAWPENVVLPWLKPKMETTAAVATAEPSDLHDRILAYLAAIPGAVEGNGGDQQTFTVACELVNGWNLTAEQALPYLQAYSDKCEPAWTQKELLHKLSEAEKAPHQKPRGHFIGCTLKIKKRDTVNLTGPNIEVQETINWENSTNSTNLPPRTTQIGYIHPCIYPRDSILSDFMELGQEICESADPFLLGSCLPGVGAILARRIRFPFGHEIQFPNLFNMLAGPPGTRKSSAIEFSNSVMKGCLSKESWMSKRFSVETLFDEYDSTRGGSPDKYWVFGDAKPILTDWKKTSYGERVAAEVLDLYDCRGMSENFRRNATKKDTQTRRYIPQTSTSLVFGATFGDASFPGQAVQSGIARRFIFHVAEDTGRDRDLPPDADMEPLINLFSRMRAFQGVCTFTKEAEKLWKIFHHDNKVRIRTTDSRCEAEIHRLNSAVMQTLHVAMIFEACILAKQNKPGFDKISLPALSTAIDHVDACLEAAKYLDSVSNQCATLNDAEILLAKIRKDFRIEAKGGAIILTRSQITAAYAPHSSRQGSWTPDVIFLRLIPALIRERNAMLYDKVGKKERYAFRCE
jgi:hypothetical protein